MVGEGVVGLWRSGLHFVCRVLGRRWRSGTRMQDLDGTYADASGPP